MRAVSATRAKQSFAEVLDTAQREPVVIRRHNRDIAVVMAPEEYDRIRRIRVAEYRRLSGEIGREAAASGMTPELLKELLDEDSPAPGR